MPPPVEYLVDNRDMVYAAVNTSELPPIPFHRMMQGQPTLTETKVTYWHCFKYPYLAFVLSEIRFEGPLLGCLGYRWGSLPVVPFGRLFCLDKEVLQKWVFLESYLKAVLAAILRLPEWEFGAFLEHLDYQPIFWRNLGYQQNFRSEEEARRGLIRARNAFVPLMASVSYAIARRTKPEELGVANPAWLRTLGRRVHGMEYLHTQLLQDLASSSICDWTLPRVGTVFDPRSEDGWWSATNILHKMRIPYWVFWGKTWTTHTPFPYVNDHYLPSAQQVQLALTKRDWGKGSWPDEPQSSWGTGSWPDEPQSSWPSGGTIDQASFSQSQPPLSSQSSPPSSTSTQFPKVPQHSRQCVGETWKAYFIRQAARVASVLEEETPQQCQERLQRETHSAKHKIPGRHGARVFHWVQSDVPGFRIREPMPRHEVGSEWTMYGDAQRRYNSVDDEWDICTEFDNTEAPDDDLYDWHASDAPPDENEAPFLEVDNSIESGLQATYPEQQEPIAVPPLDPFTTAMQHRYGLLPEAGEFTPMPEKRLELMRMAFGYSRSCIPYGWAYPIIALGNLLNPRESQSFVHPFRDLDLLASMESLVQSSNVAASHADMSGVTVSRTTDPRARSDPIYYVLQSKPLPDNTQTAILVQGGATALQAMRGRWGPRHVDIALNLVMRGIQCRTLVPLDPSLIRAPSQRPPIRLGWRERDHQFDTIEYHAYEMKRDDFLSSHAHARAALLAGGITWRLAFDSLGEETVRDLVRHGPSQEAHTSSGFHFGPCCDDQLAPDEYDLICGVYKVWTDRPEQTADLSWWPKHTAWAGSGLDWGYWTPTDETWFQKRLEDIRAGRAVPLNATTWSHTPLKFQRATPKIVSANIRHSNFCLQELTPKP